MKRCLHRVGIVAIALLLLTACVGDDEPQGATLKAGDMVPSLSVMLNDGTVFDNSSMAGKTAVIVFFNTSCSDCRRELPAVQRFWEENADNDDLVLACIAREESDESISQYWNEQGFTMPYSAQTTRRVYNLFATVGIPRVYVADPRGLIIHSYGPDDTFQWPAR